MIQQAFYKIARIEYIKFLKLLIKNVGREVENIPAKKYIRENNLHIKKRNEIFERHTIN
jgi:hypothetical protein